MTWELGRFQRGRNGAGYILFYNCYAILPKKHTNKPPADLEKAWLWTWVLWSGKGGAVPSKLAMLAGAKRSDVARLDSRLCIRPQLVQHHRQVLRFDSAPQTKIP